jgi:CDGSH-type Zn-finger protein
MSAEQPDVVVCPGGPMLLRGDHVVQDADGTRHRTTRPVSAVCRCGLTGRAPWCDGTHQLAPGTPRHG